MSQRYLNTVHFFRRTLITLAISFGISNLSVAQWSISTSADSSLFVCPGYYPSLIAFEDGSSIICGALNDYRFVQKLDPAGLGLWPQPVQVYYTPGTDDPYLTGMIGDDDGGVILWWRDYRGTSFNNGELYTQPLNNALFMQRVDKNGIIRWQVGGIQVDSVAGGLKSAYGVKDGLGGIILYKDENFLDSTSKVVKAYRKLERYDSEGRRVWFLMIDSSTNSSGLNASQGLRLGSKIMIGSLNGPRFFDSGTGAALSQPSFVPDGNIVLDQDNAAFSIKLASTRFDSVGRKFRIYSVTRVNENWEAVWTNEFDILDAGDFYNTIPMQNPAFPDGLGGLYLWEPSSNNPNVRGARLRRITASGSYFNDDRVQVFTSSFASGFGGLGRAGLYLDNGLAVEFDSTATLCWPDSFVVIRNPSDTYAVSVGSDNNGGAIVAFWSTVGGIYAQHTGRVGKVGRITAIQTSQHDVPSISNLSQNYPNPFNPTTTIRFNLASRSKVVLTVYNMLGQRIAELVNRTVDAGVHEVMFDASRLASGVYFYRIEAGAFEKTKSFVLLK